MIYQDLLTKYPIISDQIERPAMGVVLRELEKILENDVAGDITEFGCYIGTTGLFMRRLLNHYDKEERTLYAYDSFAGLPDKTTADSSAIGVDFKGGELYVSKKQFLQTFQKAGLQAPKTHKAWFKDLAPNQLPEEIAYAFLDGDFYESIRDSLEHVWPRLSPGGMITIDDYGKDALPGVERAVSEYFRGIPIHLYHEHNIAVITAR